MELIALTGFAALIALAALFLGGLIINIIAAGTMLAFSLYLGNTLVAPAGNATLPFMFAGISGLLAFWFVYRAVMSALEIWKANSPEAKNQAWLDSLDPDEDNDEWKPRRREAVSGQRQEAIPAYKRHPMYQKGWRILHGGK